MGRGRPGRVGQDRAGPRLAAAQVARRRRRGDADRGRVPAPRPPRRARRGALRRARRARPARAGGRPARGRGGAAARGARRSGAARRSATSRTSRSPPARCASLEEARIAALACRVEADVAAGRHAEVIGELRGLVAEHPTHEGFAAQLMLALYRCGRQAEALDAYQDARERLVGELGVEPGPELRDLQEAILRHDPQLTPQPAELPDELAAAARPADPRPHRRAGLAARALGARRGRPRRARADHRRRPGSGGRGSPPSSRRRSTGAATPCSSPPAPAPAGRCAARSTGRASRSARRCWCSTTSTRADADAMLALDALARRARRGCPCSILAVADEHRGGGRRAARRLDRARADRRRGGPRDRGGARPGRRCGRRSPPSCSGPPPRASPRACTGSPPSGRATEAERRVGALVGEAAAGRARLRSMEDELAGDVALLRRSARGPAGTTAAS